MISNTLEKEHFVSYRYERQFNNKPWEQFIDGTPKAKMEWWQMISGSRIKTNGDDRNLNSSYFHSTTFLIWLEALMPINQLIK